MCIPPINALAVNGKTGIPDSGCDYYLKTYLPGRLSRKGTAHHRKVMAEETREDVWRFSECSKILEHYGLKALRGGIPSLEEEGQIQKPQRGGCSTEPESEAHRQLREWIAQNPQILNTTTPFPRGKCEYLVAPADRADVFLRYKGACLAVEDKAHNANDADLNRGIFQCVKYQALLRAELKAQGKNIDGRSCTRNGKAPAYIGPESD